jgi:hypothetical protein
MPITLFGENFMKRIGFILLLLLITSTAYGAEKLVLGEILAHSIIGIEHYRNGKFINMIGRLEFGYGFKDSLSLVDFVKLPGNDSVIALPDVYIITKAHYVKDKVIYVEGTTQYGNIIKGTVEIMNNKRSKVNLEVGDSTIVNLTDTGRKFKAEYLPKVDLDYFK